MATWRSRQTQHHKQCYANNTLPSPRKEKSGVHWKDALTWQRRMLSFLETTDSRILYETTRLIHTCLSYEKTQLSWFGEIRQLPSVYESILFILKSSTNDELLKSTAVLLDKLLDSDEDLLRQWTSSELVEAVCEAAEQARLSSFDATCTFIMTLQLLSTTEAGVAVLVEYEQKICSLLCNTLLTMELPEERGEEGERGDCQGPLTALLSLLATLSDNSSSGHIGASLSASNIQELLENLHRVYTHEQSGASGPSTAVSQDHTLEQERSHVSPSGDAVEHNEQSCSSRKTTGESAGESQNPNQRIQTLIQRFLYSHSAPVPSQ